MKFKKALPRAPVVLSVEEHRRVVQYVGLLVAVAKRADIRHVKVRCISANKRKFAEEKDTGLKQKQKNKVRKICEPCFFEQTIYPETGILKLKNPLKWFEPPSPRLRRPGKLPLTSLILSFVEGTTSGFYIQRDYHDRHHSFHIGQWHVSHYGT